MDSQKSKQQNGIQKYPKLSQSFKDTIRIALQCKNQLFSCNKTAQILKESFEKANQKRMSEGRLLFHKRSFEPLKCQDGIFKTLKLQQLLRKAQMIRFPLHDIHHNYDHYVTIFQQGLQTEQSQNKMVWLLVHSWQNVYSLQNWVCDVDVQTISENLYNQSFDPITHIRDFLGYYNEKWFYEFYKDRQHEKHNIFPRFSEIFSFNSNDHRRIQEIQWYSVNQ